MAYAGLNAARMKFKYKTLDINKREREIKKCKESVNESQLFKLKKKEIESNFTRHFKLKLFPFLWFLHIFLN